MTGNGLWDDNASDDVTQGLLFAVALCEYYGILYY